MDHLTQTLVGRRVLLTGGTTGIGRATLRCLAEDGARVLTCGRHQEPLDEALSTASDAPGEVKGLVADVATPEGIDRIFESVDSELGGLDVLIVCAALGAEPAHEMSDEAWRNVVETNLTGCIASARAALDRFDPEQGGHLVLISSISVHIKAPGESLYAATKAGVNGFAETLRKEVADRNVKVSVIEPGSVGSDMQPCDVEAQREAIARDEMLQAEEIAEAIRFVITRSRACDVVTLRIEPRVQKYG